MTNQEACIIVCSSNDNVYESRTGLSVVQPCCAAYTTLESNGALGPGMQPVDTTRSTETGSQVLKSGESETPKVRPWVRPMPVQMPVLRYLLTGGVTFALIAAFPLSPVASLDAQSVDSRPSLSVPC